jgi:hypothetical protein
MHSRLWLVAASFLLAQCAVIQPPGPDAFSFAVLGDTPYNDAEEPVFLDMLDRLGGEKVEFLVHVGDIKAGGNSRCTDALYLKRKAQFDTSAHPLVFTPGDNDWTDCRRKSNGGDNPIERLNRMREIFFADGFSLGAKRMKTDVQSKAFAENRMWERAGVVFATINVQGSNNNRGFDAENDREADARDQANLAWIDAARARAESGKALVVFTQADFWTDEAPVYRVYVDALIDAAARLRKPVLFVHGDTHQLRIDTPFRTKDGRFVPNPMRLEVYGSPFVGWVRVDVDTTRPDVFTIEPKLVKFVFRPPR